MRMGYKHLWIAAALCTVLAEAGSNDIYAPVGGEGKGCSVSIDTLIKTSYMHYPSISASQKLILSTQAQKEGARWNYFPTPSVDISQRGGRRGTTFSLDQPLWTGGKLDAKSDYAFAQGDEAKYTLGESGYALAQRVIDVLQSYIQAEGDIRGYSEGKAHLEELSKMLEKRVSAGVSAEADSQLLNARIAQISADLISAQAKYDMARSQLEILTGKKLECAIGLANDRMLQHPKPLEMMEEEMIRTHPTLKKMDAQIAMAKAEKKSADAAVMPNVSLRAEHQRGSVYENTNVDNENLAYVAVSFNPGAGLSSLSNIESARYRVMQAMDERNVQEQELKDALVMDYADYTASSGQIESMQRNIAASKEVLESYGRMFVAGKRQWLDLVNASRDLTQSQITLATLRAVMVTSAYRLALQAGKIDLERKAR